MVPYSLPRIVAALTELTEKKRFIPIRELALIDSMPEPHTAVLRFDAERNPKHHLNVASLLVSIGIRSTMYFQTRTNAYDANILRQIQDLGHEIGYHYECLDRTGGDFEAARSLFLKEVDFFRKDGIDVTTTCRHGESGLPMRGYSSGRDLIDKFPELLAEAGIVADVPWFYLRQRDWRPTIPIDTFLAYKTFWDRMATGAESSNLLVITLHAHRWHNSPVRRIASVGRDLFQRYSNKLKGRRKYRTVTS